MLEEINFMAVGRVSVAGGGRGRGILVREGERGGGGG